MDFLGGALPNVMFIIGILAIGLGLGIELKLVPLNKEIDKTGRLGAIVVGAILVATSLYIYLNPSLANRNPASAAQAPAVAAPANNAQVVAAAPTAVSPAAPAPASLATAAPAPTAVPSPLATAAPAPTATPIPTAVPPTAAPRVKVPDLHGMTEKDAQAALKQAGLQAHRVDKCEGSDKGAPKVKKHQVQCQNPAANTAVPAGTTVDYVLS
jgi:hypothetical protein